MNTVQRCVQDAGKPSNVERAGPRARPKLSMQGRAAPGVAAACLAPFHAAGVARARRGAAVNTPAKGAAIRCVFYLPPTGTETVPPVARRGFVRFT